MLVEVTPAECGERRYGFVTAVSAPNPTNVTMNCGGEITQYTQPWSITLNSDINYSSMSQFQGDTLKGNYSQGLVSWSWDMNAN